MKKEILYDYKTEFVLHSILKPYSNERSQKEYKRLRSNEKSNLTFSHWEKYYVYKDESDEDRKKRHEQEDSKREINMLDRGLLLTTSIITLVAEFVDLIYKWIASWSQTSQDNLPDLDIEKLCRNSPFEEKLNTVYNLRIESGHIFINDVDMGPDFCVKAFKFREVIVMSTQAGDFYKPTKGKHKVVEPPAGAVVSSLPDGASTVVIGGDTYFRHGRTYYKAESAEGSVAYEVVDVHV